MKKDFIDCSYSIKYVFYDIKTNKPIVISEKTRLEHGLCICRTGGGKTSTFLLPCIYETIQQKMQNRELQQRILKGLFLDGHVGIAGGFPNDSFNMRSFIPLTQHGKEALINLTNNCDDATIVTISTDSSFGKGIRKMCLEANYRNYYCIDPELFVENGEAPYDTPYGINPLFIPPDLPTTEKIQRSNNRAELLAETISKIADAISDRPSDSFYMSLDHSIIKTISQVLMLSFYDKEGRHPTLRDLLQCLLNYGKLEPYMIQMAENYGDDGRPMSFSPPTISDYRINCGENLSVLYSFAMRLVTSNERSVIVTQAEGLMNAMNRLLGNISVARMLCSKNTLDIDKLISQSAVIMFNTAIKISDTTASFLGQLYTMVYKDAILQRRKDDNSGRSMRDPITFFFADEVASYMSKHLEPLFTLMRGYRASSYLAIQSNSQFEKSGSTKYLKNVFNENPALLVRMGGMGMKEAEELEKESRPVVRTEEYMYNGEWGLRSVNTHEYTAQQLNMLPFKRCAVRLIDEGNPQYLKIARLDWIPDELYIHDDVSFNWKELLDEYYQERIFSANAAPRHVQDRSAPSDSMPSSKAIPFLSARMVPHPELDGPVQDKNEDEDLTIFHPFSSKEDAAFRVSQNPKSSVTRPGSGSQSGREGNEAEGSPDADMQNEKAPLQPNNHKSDIFKYFDL